MTGLTNILLLSVNPSRTHDEYNIVQEINIKDEFCLAQIH